MSIWRVLLLHTVLIHAVTLVLRPATSYRALELGVSPAWLGVVSASFAVVPLLAAFWVGRVTDRGGERTVLRIGSGLVVVSAAGFAFAGQSLGLLVWWSAVLGVGHLLSMVGGQSLVAHSAPPGASDRWFGRYAFAGSLGQVLGPLLVAAVDDPQPGTDAGRMFLAALVVSLLFVAAAFALPDAARHDPDDSGSAGGVGAVMRAPGLSRAIFVSLAVVAAVDLIVVYLPALGAERGWSAQVVGGLLALRGIAAMASRFGLGGLTDRFGLRPVLVVGTGLAAVSLAVLPALDSVALLGVAVVLLGLGLGVGQPLTMSWVAQAAPSGLRATALAMRITGNRLGQVAVPATVGLAASGAGVGGVLLATAGVVAVAAAASAGPSGSRRPDG